MYKFLDDYGDLAKVLYRNQKEVTLKEIINQEYRNAWILKDRIIHVPDFCHSEYAFRILKDILHIDENHQKKIEKRYYHLEYSREYSMYRIMYRMGFIRVSVDYIDFDWKLSMEYSQDYKPNEYQQRLLNRADSVDTINIYYKKGH